jgi:hypothetical protein
MRAEVSDPLAKFFPAARFYYPSLVASCLTLENVLDPYDTVAYAMSHPHVLDKNLINLVGAVTGADHWCLVNGICPEATKVVVVVDDGRMSEIEEIAAVTHTHVLAEKEDNLHLNKERQVATLKKSSSSHRLGLAT